MKLVVETGAAADAPAIAAVRTAAAAQLTTEFGRGHWSMGATDAGVARDMRTSMVLVARADREIVGTLRLARKKPWAIDVTYFTAARRPLYLVDMAVHPSVQRRGVGRSLMHAARDAALDWPADAIRLDAYDSPAGAGGFYAACGYREVGRVSYHRVPLVYFELVLEPGRAKR